MILFPTENVRRIVGRLERGERLPESLGVLAEQHGVTAAWLTGIGAFEWVELAEYDQAAQQYRPSKRFDNCEILSLSGNISLKQGALFPHVHVAVSRETDNGLEVLGGHLVDGVVFACELKVECYDDLALGRETDPATGLSLWAQNGSTVIGDAAPRTEKPAEEAVSPSWAQVAAASGVTTVDAKTPDQERTQQATRTAAEPPFAPQPLPQRKRVSDKELFEEPIPERGEWVDHKQFGLCRVDGEGADGGLIIRLPSGVRKIIRLDYLEVQAPRIDGDRRIYPLVPRRR